MLFEVDAAYSVALKIMKKFDLVMIAEHFDESMILMADLLCWPLKYVASFKNNVLPSNKKVFEIVKFLRSFAQNNPSILTKIVRVDLNQLFPSQENLTESDAIKLEKWQEAEVRLYDNFLMEFQERIDIYGREKLSLKVNELQQLRKKLKLACDVREYNSKTLLKTETKKYSYSVPFNRNVIHYISG